MHVLYLLLVKCVLSYHICLVTSRKPRDDEKDGQAYRFVSRAEMEADIKAGRYLEHGEYEGNLYGTKIDSILEVVQTGRTCILDVNPQVWHTNTSAEALQQEGGAL